MRYENLEDLVLAGVYWELSERPFVECYNNISEKEEKPQKDSDPYEMKQRTIVSVIPPITPTQPISAEIASAMASRPVDILSLNRMIEEFNHPLRSGATKVVLPYIAPNPNGLMIITDIPGIDDDKSGKILSGKAGEILDKMLAAINMSRKNVSIMPLIFWRTPGGRTPTRTELDLARPFVDRAIEMLNPRIILTLGTLAASEIGKVQLLKTHDEIVELPENRLCIPIFHPNYLLLKRSAKQSVWLALQNIEKLLKKI